VLCAASGSQVVPVVAPDDSGGAIVAWLDNRSGETDIYAQRVDSSGVVLWTADGVPICTEAHGRYNHVIVGDGAGGAVIAWDDYRNDPTLWSDSDLYAQRVGPAGGVQWAPGGVPLCMADGSQMQVALTADGAGGAVAAWVDLRSDTGWWTNPDLYAQRLSPVGAPLWTADGIPLCTAPLPQWLPSVVADGAGGAFVVWQDRRSRDADLIYAQRLTGGGVPVPGWPGDGLTSAQVSVASTSTEPGLVRVTWLATSGSVLRASVYRCTASTGWSMRGVLLPDGTGRFSFDDRDVVPGTRYGYRLGIAEGGAERFVGEIWIEVPMALTLSLGGAQPNPASGALTVTLTLPGAAPATLELLDVGGRRVASRSLAGLGPGPHFVRLDVGRRPAPGIYLLRLTQGDRTLIRKACVVR
jgi:hypothetical protein